MLIENWKRCWRMYSVQLAAVIIVLGVLQSAVLPHFKLSLSPELYSLINTAIAALLVYVRQIPQKSVSGDDKPT